MNFVARIVVATFPLVSLVGGCSSQSEGQRCDLPEDCETGLACEKNVCCPPSGKSSAPACNPGISLTPDGGPTVDAAAETSTTAESSVEAADETTPEATTETSTPEASTEATTPEVEAAADAPTE